MLLMCICRNVSSVIRLLNVSLRCANCIETETACSVTVFFFLAAVELCSDVYALPTQRKTQKGGHL